MKKLLALIMVFGLASLVSADLLELSINGETAPDVWPVVLVESETLDLDLTAIPAFSGGQYAIQVVGPGSLSWDNIAFTEQYINVYIPGTYIGHANWEIAPRIVPTVDPTPQRVTMDGGNFQAGVAGPSKIMDGLKFHCDGEGDVLIQVVSDGVYAAGVEAAPGGVILDEILIHQIPEPMTMALLGLGGLALIRRRR